MRRSREINMIRKMEHTDANKLRTLLEGIDEFTKEEIVVAMELIEIAASNEKQKDYNVFVYDEEGEISGYYCAGKRPLTESVYDLYWIVTDPKRQRKGVGKALLNHAEKFVKSENGKLILAETSSQESYGAAQEFYKKNNYSLLAEIKDFYKKNDNLLIFGKYL